MTSLWCVLLMVIAVVNTQVTFSRDWSAGKRNWIVSTPTCQRNMQHAFALTQLLNMELRQILDCGVRLRNSEPPIKHDSPDNAIFTREQINNE